MLTGRVNQQMLDTFRELFRRIDPTHIKCCVAGGAVVDFNRANDIDVFVFSQDYRAVLQVIEAIGSRNYDPDTQRLAPDLPYEGGHADEFFRAGVCRPDWSPKPIHVTGYAGGTRISDLLRTFDLSVHAWALDRDLTVHRISGSTFPNEPIHVHYTRSTTPARLVKLSQRYHPAHELVGADGH